MIGQETDSKKRKKVVFFLANSKFMRSFVSDW